MSEIKITVRNKIAVGDGTEIVCGNSDYTVRFDLDSEWDSLTTRTMRVKRSDGIYTDTVFTGDTCTLPMLVNVRSVEIGLYAGNLHTTVGAAFKCNRSILCGNGIPSAPVPYVYNQIMSHLNGFSATVEKSGDTATITITDPNGTHTASLSDGEEGVGITSIVFARKDAQGGNVYTVTMTNGATYEITAPKGDAGSGGGNVTSVNGQTGIVVLDADDVGALPDDTVIPTKTSDLTNDSGFLTAHQSLAAYRTAAEQDAIHDATKVDKVTGKGLSANDYDATEKANVAANTAARHSHANKALLDGIVSTDLVPSTEDANLGDVLTVGLNGVVEWDMMGVIRDAITDEDIVNAWDDEKTYVIGEYVYTPSRSTSLIYKCKQPCTNVNPMTDIVHNYWDVVVVMDEMRAKQDTISDLSTIRSGAALGATALQQHQSLAAYRTAAQQDAIHDSTKQDVIGDLQTIRSGAAAGATALQSVPSAYRTAAEQDAIHDSAKQDVISDLSTIRNGATAGSTAVQPNNTKTINGNSIVGTGNITIGGGEIVAKSGDPTTGVVRPATAATRTSQLTNDSGFLTLATLPIYDGSVI